MDAAERSLLEEAVGAALASPAAGADEQLANLGWLEMLAAEPRDAIAVVFEALGATNGSATVLDDVVVSALGLQARADLAVVLPPFGAWDPSGVLDDGTVSAVGLATARITTASEVLVLCHSASELRAVTVPASATDSQPVLGVDPEAGFHTVRLAHGPVAGEVVTRDAWDAGVPFGQRAVAHQMLGASRAMLTLARDYSLERIQFGRSIASFQAVRHRLAEALVAVESLEATLGAAADEPNAVTAALAKATAGRTVRTVAAHSQQVLAGIGFTTDHPFHRFLKRTMLLEGVFGSADEIAMHLGHQLLAARKVPTLIEL